VSGLKLRPYQEECIESVFSAWRDGMRRPAVVLPTGAGKTVVFSELINRFQESMGVLSPPGVKGRRVMVLAHRDELVDQAIAKIRAVLPEHVTVGKVKAEDNQITSDVMVCSVQTLASARRRALLQASEVGCGPVGLIITDECHHAAAPSYRKVYDAFPDALQLGVTATLARGDRQGLGDVWEGVVYKRSILWMIKNGYLTDVRAERVNLFDVDMSSVKVSRGDYQAGDMGRALMEAEAHLPIAQAYVKYAGGRKAIVFTPTVDTAHATAEALETAGVRTAVVSGDTPRDERLAAYEAFRTGGVDVLSNCMVLTEGFDAPWAEVAIIARPTQSQPLYTQMVGRILRPYPGKTSALVLDVVGASASNKLCTLIDLEPGAVHSLEEDETLAQAEEREEREAEEAAVPGAPAKFFISKRDANLFAGYEAAWNKTPKGVLFIACGDVRVFLWPSTQGGAWDVCLAPKGGKWERTEHAGLDLASAMAWGEAVADDNYGGFSTKVSASWRKGPPTDRQLQLADALGINPAGLSKGELSEAMDRVMAAQMFDRHVR